MIPLIAIVGLRSLSAFQWVTTVVLGIPAIVVALLLIPKGAWKPLLRICALGFIYRYFYPRRRPIADLQQAYHFAVSVTLNTYGYRASVWFWLNNSAHIALLVAAGALIGFMTKTAKDRAKEKRQLEAEFNKQTPNLTVHFTLSEDEGTICSIVNLGAGTAISVKFRFYLLDERRSGDDGDPEPLMIRNRKNKLLVDDPKRIWRLREVREFPYILPQARRPRTIPLGIVPVEHSHEIRLEMEYVDVLDRTYFQYAHGGQSSDHEVMGFNRWYKTVEGRQVVRPSNLQEVMEILSFYVGRFFRLKTPMIESECRLLAAKVDRSFQKEKKGTDDGSMKPSGE